MPKGLLDKLTGEEILDLVAYVVAGAMRSTPCFREDMSISIEGRLAPQTISSSGGASMSSVVASFAVWSEPSRSTCGQATIAPSTTRIVPIPPPTTEPTGPNHSRRDPRLEPAQLVRRADEDGVDRRHPARIASGVSTCTRVPRTTTLMLSRAPVRASMANDRTIVARQAEDDRRGAEAGDRPEQGPAGAAQRRPVGQDQGHQQRPQRRGPRGASPGPRGADVEDVLGEDRQQRRRPAEQHGEQVERDRRQDQLGLSG